MFNLALYFLEVNTPGLSDGWKMFLIGQAVAIFIGLISIYVRMVGDLKEVKLRTTVSEKRILDTERRSEKTDEKIDKVLENINVVRIELQNKANR